MTTELNETIDRVLPDLEAIRERIVQLDATNANRVALDRAYQSVADAIRTLSMLSAATQSPARAQ